MESLFLLQCFPPFFYCPNQEDIKNETLIRSIVEKHQVPLYDGMYELQSTHMERLIDFHVF